MIKKYIGTGIVALGLLFSVGFAAPAQATSLTSAQVSAIINLLQSFGADQSTINSVQVALGGSSSGSLSCSSFADLSYGDFDNDSGGRVSQLQTFLGISSNTFGFGTYGRKTQGAWNNMCGQQATQPTTPTVTPVVTPQPTTTSAVPNISYINPTTTSVGSTVYVYGSNLYGNPFSLDGSFGLYGVNYPDTSGNSFSFVVPSSMSVGTHTLHIEQKVSGVSGNSVTFTVTAVPNISSIKSENNTPIHAGDMVIVSGSNLYGAPFTLDGNYGTPVSQQDSSGTSFSFVVPWNTSAGTHTVRVEQKVTGVPGNSVTFTVVAAPASTPTIDSFSVNGYSQVINGKVNVYNVINPTVQWSSSNASYCRATSVEGISQAATTDFTGTQPTSGSQQLMFGNSYYNQREITLTCYNQNGVSSNTVDAWIGGKG